MKEDRQATIEFFASHKDANVTVPALLLRKLAKRLGGTFFCVSYGKPDTRMEYLSKEILNFGGRAEEVQIEEAGDELRISISEEVEDLQVRQREVTMDDVNDVEPPPPPPQVARVRARASLCSPPPSLPNHNFWYLPYLAWYLVLVPTPQTHPFALRRRRRLSRSLLPAPPFNDKSECNRNPTSPCPPRPPSSRRRGRRASRAAAAPTPPCPPSPLSPRHDLRPKVGRYLLVDALVNAFPFSSSPRLGPAHPRTPAPPLRGRKSRGRVMRELS